MEPTNLTIEILKSIRDDVKAVRDEARAANESLRSDFAGLRGEFANMRGDFAGLRGEVTAVREQQVRSEIRLSTEIVACVGEFRALREDLRTAGFRARLEDHEHRIEELEKGTD